MYRGLRRIATGLVIFPPCETRKSSGGRSNRRSRRDRDGTRRRSDQVTRARARDDVSLDRATTTGRVINRAIGRYARGTFSRDSSVVRTCVRRGTTGTDERQPRRLLRGTVRGIVATTIAADAVTTAVTRESVRDRTEATRTQNGFGR